MNSRFRFRAFHKSSKKMFEVFSFCDKYIKTAVDFRGEKIITKHKIEDFEPIQQFLTIEDKDWWEGDVIGYENDTSKALIVWDKELGRFGLHYDTHDADIICQLDYFHLHHCIKLGNIYENPKLLKNNYHVKN